MSYEDKILNLAHELANTAVVKRYADMCIEEDEIDPNEFSRLEFKVYDAILRECEHIF